MIHLDSSVLIALADTGDPHHARALSLMRAMPDAGASVLAWWEFQCGPLRSGGAAMVRRLLPAGLFPFGEAHAVEAARLFNTAGRARRFKFDSMIAATAILAGASLATANPADFEPFVICGLELAPF
jgi:predicted nucleic acid-binding protein